MQQRKTINIISEEVVGDLMVKVTSDSKLSIAAAPFSIYAYEVLKAEIKIADERRFVFTSPTFITEKVWRICMLRSPPRLYKEKHF